MSQNPLGKVLPGQPATTSARTRNLACDAARQTLRNPTQSVLPQNSRAYAASGRPRPLRPNSYAGGGRYICDLGIWAPVVTSSSNANYASTGDCIFATSPLQVLLTNQTENNLASVTHYIPTGVIITAWAGGNHDETGRLAYYTLYTRKVTFLRENPLTFKLQYTYHDVAAIGDVDPGSWHDIDDVSICTT